MIAHTLTRISVNSPPVIWCFGYPAAGKSTLAECVCRHLRSLFVHVALLDGDILRKGLCSNLGFTPEDRTENIRRTAEAAVLLAHAGINVVVACITPLEADRALARRIIGEERFWDVFVDTDLAVCQQRDPKGHYTQALNGALPNFTGVSAPFEKPLAPRIRVCTAQKTVMQGVEVVFAALQEYYGKYAYATD